MKGMKIRSLYDSSQDSQMFVYRSTLSISKREDGMDERYIRTTHDVWLSGFHHDTYPRHHKGVIFTIGRIYFSLLLLPRCLITRFSPRHISLSFFSIFFKFFFWIFWKKSSFLDNAPWNFKPWYTKELKWHAQRC